jgi:hypothetical protein
MNRKIRTLVDFSEVKPEHQQVHGALLNWGVWLSPTQRDSCSVGVSPMFAQAKSNARQWHTPDLHIATDQAGAQQVESLVRDLPTLQAAALRWQYVGKTPVARALQVLQVDRAQLLALVHAGRERCRALLGL